MEKCIKDYGFCIQRDGKDYRKLIHKCCLDEVREDQEIVQNVMDTLSDGKMCPNSLKRIASKLSYASNLLNHNNESDLLEIMPLLKRYAVILFEFTDKILNDNNIYNLIKSLNIELEKWFELRFMNANHYLADSGLNKSIISDIQTVEMSLGMCVLEQSCEDSIEDLFF